MPRASWRCSLSLAPSYAPLPARARPAVLRDIRPIIATDYTRLVIEVSRRVPYELRVVPANLAAGVPARIYVDLHQTRLAGVEASRLSPAAVRSFACVAPSCSRTSRA